MSKARHVRLEEHDQTLIVTPLFTFATFADPDVAGEWKAVEQRLKSPGTRQLMIDLGEIPYFGSTMLHWMSQMWKRIKAKGGKLAIARATPIGREVLAAARFDKLWAMFATREEALAWLHREENASPP